MSRPHNKAVVDGELLRVSASQITTFERCNLKWWFEKVAGIKVEQTQKQEVGERIHDQMQKYYETGVVPEHPSARLLVDSAAVPKPDVRILAEHPRDYNLGLHAAGVPMLGRIDLLDLRSLTQTVGVVDFKSTSSLYYSKTPEELERNIQLITYGEFAFRNWSPDAVRLTHAYILTRGVGTKIVSTDPLSRQHVAGMYGAIETTVESMCHTAKFANPHDVKPNLAACGDFGGCPYRDSCPAANPYLVEGTEDMSLAEKIKARRSLQTVTSSTQPPSEGATNITRAVGINPPDAALHDIPTTPYVSVTLPPNTTTTDSTDGTMHAFTSEQLVLFVDCRPDKGIEIPVRRLEDEIEVRAGPIAKAAGVTDVREVTYGAGTAALVSAFKRNPPTGIFLANTGGLSSLVLEALVPLAVLVVRGTR